jgi:hypothetical protein
MRAAALMLVVVAACSSDEGRPTDWNLVEIDGTTLEISAARGSSSCQSLGGVATTADDDHVEVLVNVMTSDEPECTADADLETVFVELDSPLGTRDLLGCRPEDPEGFPMDRPGQPAPSDCRETSERN